MIGSTYLLNSEGTKIKSDWAVSRTGAIACGQTSEGRYFFSTEQSFHPIAKGPANIDAVALAHEMERTSAADTMDYYIGPVLFTGQASAMFFLQLIENRFASPRDLLTERNTKSGDDFGNRIGKRVMAKGLNVWDDPQIEALDGHLLTGHYKYDYEGVPAQRVSLVEDGVLVDFLSCRTPTPHNTTSNGHGRGAWGKIDPAIGNLFIESENPSKDIHKDFIKSLHDLDLDYGIVVEKLYSPDDFGFWKSSSVDRLFRDYSQQMQMNRSGLFPPILVYRLYQDGHKEYLHNTIFLNMTTKSLFDIEGTSPARYVYNAIGGFGYSIISPETIMVRDVEITNMNTDGSRLPVTALFE